MRRSGTRSRTRARYDDSSHEHTGFLFSAGIPEKIRKGVIKLGFLNMTHRKRFSKIWSSFQRKSPRFIAAVFLLTSTEEIWSRAEACITKDGTLDISNFRIKGISTTAYTLYMAARDLYFETDMVSVYALTDHAAVPDAIVGLINTAVMIRRDCLKTVRKMI